MAWARRSKYGAKPVVIDGIRFASTREGARYRELTLLQKAGEIHNLQLQPVFPLAAVAERDGARHLIGKYIADFTYCRKGSAVLVVEDVKGGSATKTPIYRWKVKHMRAQYGIVVLET